MPPSIDREEVLRYLGYSGQVIDEALEARIDEGIAACESTMKTRGVWRVFPVGVGEDDSGAACVDVLGTALTFPGEDIVRHLDGAVSCALMAATLGMESERELRTLSLRDPLAGLVFDAACSAWIECGVDELEGEVRAYARTQGLTTGPRFSPGYGDLPLSVQPLFLEVLSAPKRIGLSAAASNMLVPAKSVTAIVGLFEDGPRTQGSAYDRCAICPAREGCAFREKGMRCYGA